MDIVERTGSNRRLLLTLNEDKVLKDLKPNVLNLFPVILLNVDVRFVMLENNEREESMIYQWFPNNHENRKFSCDNSINKEERRRSINHDEKERREGELSN